MKSTTLDLNTQNRLHIDGKNYFIVERSHKTQVVPTRCPHRGGPLHYGCISKDGEHIVCPWHDNKFKIDRLSCKKIATIKTRNKFHVIADAKQIFAWYERGLLESGVSIAS